MSDSPRVARAKPVPTADDLHDMMESVETLESEMAHIRAAMSRFDLTDVPQIGALGVTVLTTEIDKAWSAIEWLGIIIGDAKDAVSALLSDEVSLSDEDRTDA